MVNGKWQRAWWPLVCCAVRWSSVTRHSRKTTSSWTWRHGWHPHNLLPLPSVASSLLYNHPAAQLKHSNTTPSVHTFSVAKILSLVQRIVTLVIWAGCYSFNPQLTRCLETPRIWMQGPPPARPWWREAQAARACRPNRISPRVGVITQSLLVDVRKNLLHCLENVGFVMLLCDIWLMFKVCRYFVL